MRGVLLLCALGGGAAQADEAIDRVNNQQSYALTLAPLHERDQAQLVPGIVENAELAGTRYVFGMEMVRTRSLLRSPGWYTDFALSLGSGTLRYDGVSPAGITGGPGSFDEPVTYFEENLRLRVGRGFDLSAPRPLRITPFLGLEQGAWTRESPVPQGPRLYDEGGLQLGALLQTSLPWHVVMGAEAAAGRALGAVEYSSFGNRVASGSRTFALYIDHRTFADWHQRIELRQHYWHGAPAGDDGGKLQPVRASDLAITLQMGYEFDAD